MDFQKWSIAVIVVFIAIISAEDSYAACQDEYLTPVSACCDGSTCPDCVGASCTCPSLCDLPGCPACDEDEGSHPDPTCSEQGKCGGSATSDCWNKCSPTAFEECPSNKVCEYPPVCGDGKCEADKGESCLINGCFECGTCTEPPKESCGGISGCQSEYGESCGNCPGDCGTCVYSTFPFCGDGTCNGNEYYPPSTGSTKCYDCFVPEESIIENPEIEIPNNIPEILGNSDWKPEYTAYVPADKIHLIPPDKIDVIKAKDYSKLTKAQLLYGNNFNLIVDKSLLHPDVVNQIISEAVGIGLEVVLQPGSNIFLEDDGITISKASILKAKCQNSASFVEMEDPVDLNIRYANSLLKFEIPSEKIQKVKTCNGNQFYYSSGKDGGQLFVSTNYYNPKVVISNSSIELGHETLFYKFNSRSHARF